MKKSLLLLGVIAALAISAPAYSQYIYMDVNGDGVNSSADVLTSSTTGVDVWLDTGHNENGTTTSCTVNPSQGLRMYNYDLYFRSGGTGSVAYTSWTNALAAYTQGNALTSAGGDAAVDYSAPTGTLDGPWLVKLGRLNITVTGSPTLSFVGVNPTPTGPIFTPVTGFGTECDASDFANTYTLSIDFLDNHGTASPTPTESTTWGKIKQLYR